ncbi:bifunctional 1-(5-phosphoribosyl)-5-((5-phosphoribosylamino)methylideneamino)imidazole-4-carboxamide isomerase/phosphoribosylanthranilate isomerase PriA [Corynebacterium mendelii]|uniref:1-(5-phosphoribosyl)-5-[(5-phosphoribosylamino)methylideneamino] imidazole-4-carboxamide isomerase n=1 Tax=Corynebacterium mendelii TaxID=2765362 RepID=A0A939E0H8_9CORY|nr:bifunctional 1-(5-phosphoribosyl)-5-((5-phosphoribosylamino)methylideneamino)imidazole-4-carboxamide isomerase/phosphoribosylanthranilate isomerase PriA [Corynebacterium mendelii]MBN9643608.1 bifunctional 1-(5-phosphoribosyl)-5-((5-phosphoribosylamino)methylideneamino)imidazole-4-carboxamide isomerase/phosphoribosylanthranilate isomerase PriA [Corynebacterium mendelii]
MTFTILPAVDVVNGQAVRLTKGEAGSEKTYGTPLDAARAWQDQGAEWLHFVDLDAAFGRGSNHELMAGIVAELDLNVELTGGIRDDDSLRRALDSGAARVNIGTAALTNPAWTEKIIGEWGDKVAIGLDVKLIDGVWRARGNGWTTDGGDVWEVLERLDQAGVSRLVVTDVGRDGTLEGPNIELLRDVAAATDAPVTASGGVAVLDDVTALAAYSGEGIDSVIVGKALYENRFTLPEALAAVEGR